MMDPLYHVPYGRMSGYQLYQQFKAAERDYEKSEIDKAYRDVLNRLQIQMSTLLHDYSSDINHYRYGPLDDPSHQSTYDTLYDAFREYHTKSAAFLHRVSNRLRSKIHQTLDFHYDLSGYSVDPRDNCFNSESYYFDELKERLKKDQVGKDLLLWAYSPIDYIHFYGGPTRTAKPQVLLSAPSAKKPRVVPLRPLQYTSKPYIPPFKKKRT